MTKSDWSPTTVQECFAEANMCKGHSLLEPYPDDNTVTITGAWTDYGSGWDNESFAIGLLSDGRYLVVMESEDSSGHGCRCSGSSSVHPTLDEALRLGLEPEQRAVAEEMLAAK